jgi:hypothetical protein
VPDLEERVAALEAAPGPAADFTLLPLRPDEIRQLLSECVAVVKPGETLVIRGRDWTPVQLREIQQAMDDMYQHGTVPFRALAVPGDELGVTLEPQFMQHTRVEPIDGHGVLTIRLTHEPTNISVVARDRPEGISKLRRALADRARRDYDLQETQRRRERKTEGTPGAP